MKSHDIPMMATRFTPLGRLLLASTLMLKGQNPALLPERRQSKTRVVGLYLKNILLMLLGH
jgi:hypothetical protein